MLQWFSLIRFHQAVEVNSTPQCLLYVFCTFSTGSTMERKGQSNSKVTGGREKNVHVLLSRFIQTQNVFCSVLAA